MAGLGPWPADRRVAVAVSGGADSMCLAWLAASWGKPLAIVVDHGLRANSAGEASEAATRLAGFGVPSRIRTLRVPPGPGLAARARRLRYAALADAMAEAGLSDLLLGHHAGDQAETVLMRRAAASGPAGLAGMAAIAELPALRLVRPLLGLHPSMLRETLSAQGIGWAEDPSNADPAATRTHARAALTDPGLMLNTLGAARAAGEARAAREAEIAAILAERACLFPEGYALLSPGPIATDALAALLRALGGTAYPARGASLARLAADPSPGTVAGLRLLPAGRLGSGLLLVREARAAGPPVEARDGAVWDGRFVLSAAGELPSGATLGALGDDASRLRRLSHLPFAVLRVLPALRAPGDALAVPHLGYNYGWTNKPVGLTLCPPVPASGAYFRVAATGDAQAAPEPHLPR